MRISPSSLSFLLIAMVHIYLILLLGTLNLNAQEFIWNGALNQKIDSTVNSIMENEKFPGVAVAVLHNGKVLKESYYGLANIEYQVPVTDSTVFWMASISKHIDCVGILRLEQEGKLNVKDRISKYLEDLPESWKNITIEQLMTHTSGLPEDGNEALWDSKEVAYGKTISSETIFEILKKDSLQFDPGSNFLYSGSGYSLLALIMEKVSGLKYDEFMNKHVFTPAGLKHTYTKKVLEIHPNQVTGYQVVNGKLFRDNNRFPMTDLELGGGGGVYSTLKDMIRWNEAMSDDEFLNSKSRNSMWTSYQFDAKITPLYGYGFHVIHLKDFNYVYHNGVAGTEYFKDLNSGIDLIILTNLGQYQKLPFVTQFSKILGIYPEIDPVKFSGIFGLGVKQNKESEMGKYAGNYVFEFNGQEFNPIIKRSVNGLDFYWDEKFDPVPLIPLEHGWLMLYDEENFYPVPIIFLLKPIEQDNHPDKPIQLQMNEGSWPRVILTKVN